MDPIGTLAGGWTNPFEKYACQIGANFPKVRGLKENISNHHLGPVPTFCRWASPPTPTKLSQVKPENPQNGKALQVVVFCCFPFLQ